MAQRDGQATLSIRSGDLNGTNIRKLMLSALDITNIPVKELHCPTA